MPVVRLGVNLRQVALAPVKLQSRYHRWCHSRKSWSLPMFRNTFKLWTCQIRHHLEVVSQGCRVFARRRDRLCVVALSC